MGEEMTNIMSDAISSLAEKLDGFAEEKAFKQKKILKEVVDSLMDMIMMKFGFNNMQSDKDMPEKEDGSMNKPEAATKYGGYGYNPSHPGFYGGNQYWRKRRSVDDKDALGAEIEEGKEEKDTQDEDMKACMESKKPEVEAPVQDCMDSVKAVF